MAALIDGVITAGQDVGKQCLQFVNDLVGGTRYGSAAELTSAAQSQGILNTSSTPHLGDIAVWGGGQGGALSAGHAAIVTGLSNGVQVTGTNWPGGSGAAQYTVGYGNNPVGIGQPTGFINPLAIGGKNIITGQTGTSGLQQTGSAIAPATGYKSLSQSISDASSIIPGQAGISGFANWISQGPLLRRIGFTVGGIFLMWYGLHLLTRIDSPTQVVGKVAGAVK